MTTTTAQSSKAAATDNRPPARPGRILALVLAAQFMALLDVFIVNVAAPTIRTELGASGAALQLIVAGYTISYAVLLITGARLGDRFGHRRMYMAGLALFTAASLACGLAQDTGQLIAFRLVQGAGAAVMIPQVLSLIQRTFTGEARARALGVYAAVLAGGAAAGQVLGGVLVSADLFGASWRPAFLVNVPVGLALLALAPRVLPADAKPVRARGFDLPGLLLLAAAVSLFTVPLVLGQEQDWPLWSWLSLLAAAVLFVLFMTYERKLARRGGAPLIAERVLKVPGMGLAIARIAVIMAGNAGLMFVLALHLQGGLGQSALRTGLTFAPGAVLFGVVGLTWRTWPAGLQRILVPGGFALTAVGSAVLGLALRDGGDGGLGLWLAFACVGTGMSVAYSPTFTRALATVRPEDAADASGLLATVLQLGQLSGVAVFGAVFLSHDAVTAAGSADAFLVTAFALAAAAFLGAVSGLVRVRR
ncbi:MFS transporter [Streptomyces sp. TRM66268-LWL]|uniref:MFS transporter n=1 Tax=Streptomyces polyasparticus TaxID=2767826 RepID=A0ABR7SPI7_9ACTN|nr:MFS transporter [Streptomyces polyasparticus]MBC9716258.1 MFS transporter [Streptomyces polyasparticus]